MPLNRLLFILICALGAAAATVYLATSLAARGALPAPGLIVLTVIALCASFGWRFYGDRNVDKDED